MSTITKERLEWLANISGRDDIDEIDGEEIRELARIALASLETEPVAYMYKDNLHADARFSLHTRFGNWSQEDINEYEITEIPLYTAPPAPVVPDEATPDNIQILASTYAPRGVTYQWDSDECNAAADSWNACRAAMLQGADGTLTNEGTIPVTQFKPVADLYGLTSPTGGETSFTFDAVEARDFIDGGWLCQEYVTLERYQETLFQGAEPVTTANKLPECWVACSERMPDDEEDVLCFGQYGDNDIDEERYQFMGWLSSKGIKRVWRVSDGDSQNRRARVTHWMPLPAAPQREGENV
ncbi:TPA: DUF551 domain-containing protein [Enterobacter hormaechei]